MGVVTSYERVGSENIVAWLSLPFFCTSFKINALAILTVKSLIYKQNDY